MSNKFQIPRQTLMVPTTEKNKNTSATKMRENPVSLSQIQRIAGCMLKAIATIAYPKICNKIFQLFSNKKLLKSINIYKI